MYALILLNDQSNPHVVVGPFPDYNSAMKRAHKLYDHTDFHCEKDGITNHYEGAPGSNGDLLFQVVPMEVVR